MLAPERRQLWLARHLGEALYDRHIEHTPRGDALRTIRQTTGIGHYLSRMATDEPRIYESVYYAVAIVAIDEIADELNDTVPVTEVQAAFDGEDTRDSLSVLPEAERVARSGMFRDEFLELVEWQNNSLEQLDDPDDLRLLSIAQGKGGSAGRANLAMVMEEPSHEDMLVAYDWGTTMQVLDDYIDLPHDRQAGVSTLYTAGAWDGDRLLTELREMEQKVIDQWGSSTAQKRFFRICRLLRLLAKGTARLPITPRHLIPWYV